jgi:hypothetical protein
MQRMRELESSHHDNLERSIFEDKHEDVNIKCRIKLKTNASGDRLE